MSYMQIRNFKDEIRGLARYHWINTHDPVLAEQLVREDIRNKYGSIIAAFLIALFIRLAVELIIYWWKKNFLYPEPLYQLGEPGYDD